MRKDYQEYLQLTNKEDCKESWVQWEMDEYGYPKSKAEKKAEANYYPLSPIDYQQTIVGLNIKFLRESKGLSQLGVMRAIGSKDTSVVSRWERGVYIPDASYLQKLANFFEVSVSDVMNKKIFDEL